MSTLSALNQSKSAVQTAIASVQRFSSLRSTRLSQTRPQTHADTISDDHSTLDASTIETLSEQLDSRVKVRQQELIVQSQDADFDWEHISYDEDGFQPNIAPLFNEACGIDRKQSDLGVLESFQTISPDQSFYLKHMGGWASSPSASQVLAETPTANLIRVAVDAHMHQNRAYDPLIDRAQDKAAQLPFAMLCPAFQGAPDMGAMRTLLSGLFVDLEGSPESARHTNTPLEWSWC